MSERTALEARVRRYVDDYREWMNDDEEGYCGLIEIAGNFMDDSRRILNISIPELDGEQPASVDAVDPSAASTGTPCTRV